MLHAAGSVCTARPGKLGFYPSANKESTLMGIKIQNVYRYFRKINLILVCKGVGREETVQKPRTIQLSLNENA